MTLFVDVVRDGCGELEGDAEPRRAKREARSSVGLGDRVEATEELYVGSRLTLDFLSAFRRARRSSSTELESDIVTWIQGLGRYGGEIWYCMFKRSGVCGENGARHVGRSSSTSALRILLL